MLIFLILAGAASFAYPWKSIVDLTVIPLGVGLIAVGLVLAVSAVSLFRREGTEINPK